MWFIDFVIAAGTVESEGVMEDMRNMELLSNTVWSVVKALFSVIELYIWTEIITEGTLAVRRFVAR